MKLILFKAKKMLIDIALNYCESLVQKTEYFHYIPEQNQASADICRDIFY